MTNTKSYSQLIKLPTFIERYRYLKLPGKVGVETFGFDRYLNQALYRSDAWKKIRDQVIVRDNGCDLGCEDRPIPRGHRLLIHHINPITLQMIQNRDPLIFDTENLITTMKLTHDAIHYGNEDILMDYSVVVRRPHDTSPWRTANG